mgnify:FL=1
MFKMSAFTSFVFLIVACVLVGCGDDLMTPQESGSEVSTVNTEPTIKVVPEPVQLSERDCEAIFFVLSTETISNGGQPLYLTPTGREQWNQQGDWVSMPALLSPWLARLAVEFNPAADAKLDQGYVRDKESGARGTMVWIVVKEWSSAEEVTLDFGLWGGPLDASGKTITCFKKNGRWEVKEITNVWLS